MDESQFDMYPEPIRGMLIANLQAVEDAHKTAHMMAESFRNDINNFLNEASPEHLITVKRLFADMANEQTGRMASYYEGAITSALELVHGVCGDCGENHEELALQKATAEAGKESGDDTTS